jgi:hypothetical protein
VSHPLLLARFSCRVPSAISEELEKKIEQCTINNKYYTQIRQNDKKLIVVDWEGKPEGIIGARLLSQSLEKNTTLKAINAPSNRFYAQGCKYLADVLANNQNLTYINLQQNNIRPEGATHLAEALKTNCMVTDLNLRRNGAIGDDGACALAGASRVVSRST